MASSGNICSGWYVASYKTPLGPGTSGQGSDVQRGQSPALWEVALARDPDDKFNAAKIGWEYEDRIDAEADLIEQASIERESEELYGDIFQHPHPGWLAKWSRKGLCRHCELDPARSGDNLCKPCSMYRDRHQGQLPPERLLERRRQRKADATS